MNRRVQFDSLLAAWTDYHSHLCSSKPYLEIIIPVASCSWGSHRRYLEYPQFILYKTQSPAVEVPDLPYNEGNDGQISHWTSNARSVSGLMVSQLSADKACEFTYYSTSMCRVGAGRAFPASQQVRFPTPPSEPDVRLSTHPALHHALSCHIV